MCADTRSGAGRTWGSALVSVRKPDLEIIGFLSRRRRHLERSPSGTRLCSQPENANFLSEMFPDRHLVLALETVIVSMSRMMSLTEGERSFRATSPVAL